GMSFKEPIPALSNVMDTNEHASSQTTCGGDQDVAIGLLQPVSGALKPPDRAPSPTCPFIKNRQCQRAIQRTRRTTMAPRFTPGDRSSVLCWRPKRTETVETVSAASVRGHIWTALIRVNAFLQFYFAGPSGPPQFL